jgi:hypothetical protein
MPGRRSPRRSLSRRVGFRVPRKTLVVFCEGELTEPDYLDALKRLPEVRDHAAVEIRVMRHDVSTPLALVRRACEARKRALREQAEIDEFWCLFDVEAPKPHPDLRPALELAERNGIRVAVSNPCFEVWLILHFRSYGSWLSTDDAVRLRGQLDGSKGKGVDAVRYLPMRHEAARLARLGHERHIQNGSSPPDDNPSTTMYALLASIEP